MSGHGGVSFYLLGRAELGGLGLRPFGVEKHPTHSKAGCNDGPASYWRLLMDGRTDFVVEEEKGTEARIGPSYFWAWPGRVVGGAAETSQAIRSVPRCPPALCPGESPTRGSWT